MGPRPSLSALALLCPACKQGNTVRPPEAIRSQEPLLQAPAQHQPRGNLVSNQCWTQGPLFMGHWALRLAVRGRGTDSWVSLCGARPRT